MDVVVDIKNVSIAGGQHRKVAFVESVSDEAYLKVIFED